MTRRLHLRLTNVPFTIIAALAVLAAYLAATASPVSAVVYSNCGDVRTEGSSSTSGAGGLMIAADLDDLTDHSETVVNGTVESLQSCHTSANPGYVTFVSIRVDEALKTEGGDDEVDSVRLAVDGGVVDGVGMAVGISPEFAVGERVVAFLATNGDGETVLADDYQSKLTVLDDGSIAQHDATIDEISSGVQMAADGELPDADDPLAGGPQIIESEYAFTGPWIHNGIHPVTVAINAQNNKPSQLTVNDARLAMINSFKTWQELPDNYIAFNFTNTTRTNTQSACEGKFEVTFGIDEAHGAGTLGVTFTCYIGAETIDADIEIDTDHFGTDWRTDGTGSCASGKFDLETVMLHEAGHFIGLDHPSASNCVACPVMNASYGGVHRDACADDQAGAKARYPIGSEQKPGNPNVLVAVAPSTTIDLTWVDVPLEQGFEIYRAEGLCAVLSDGDFALHNSVKDNLVTYSDSDYGAGLPVNQPFCYKVRAFNNHGVSAWSTTAQGVVGSLPTPEPTSEPTVTQTPGPTATPTAEPTATSTPSASPDSTPPPAPTSTPSPTPGGNALRGDVDCDQLLTAMDSLGILSLESSVAAPGCPENADIDCSGLVDASDAIVVLWVVSGTTQPSDVCES